MDALGKWNRQAKYEQHVDRTIYQISVVTSCHLGPSSAQLIWKSIQLAPMAIPLELHADTCRGSQPCAPKWSLKAKIELFIVIHFVC